MWGRLTDFSAGHMLIFQNRPWILRVKTMRIKLKSQIRWQIENWQSLAEASTFKTTTLTTVTPTGGLTPTGRASYRKSHSPVTFTHAWNVWNSAWKNKISHALDDVIAENVLLNWTILNAKLKTSRQYLEIENSVRILNSSELSSESECIIWFPTLGD